MNDVPSWKDFAAIRKDKRNRNKTYTLQLIRKMGYSHIITSDDNQVTIEHNGIRVHITMTTGTFTVVSPEKVKGRGIKNLIYYLANAR